jgi:hypothetical protein
LEKYLEANMLEPTIKTSKLDASFDHTTHQKTTPKRLPAFPNHPQPLLPDPEIQTLKSKFISLKIQISHKKTDKKKSTKNWPSKFLKTNYCIATLMTHPR